VVGNLANKDKEHHPKGEPTRVEVHDFPDPKVGKTIPFGVYDYDLAANEGFVTVGKDHDTAGFPVATIRQWWTTVGKLTHPDATRLLVTADAGGSNDLNAWWERRNAESALALGRWQRPPVRLRQARLILFRLTRRGRGTILRVRICRGVS